MSLAYYNEIDPYAAEWLRNLIAAGHIAPGDVDTRDIRDVRPDDLRGYRQCHFFAGVGVWSYALRRAGWGDDRPVWTGSCPCQPFSAAGAGLGFSDERHLWPSFHWLISECRPAVILGEQVAAKAVDPWVDLVHADLEGLDYAYGCEPFPSAGVGAPHIRERLYWMAHANAAGFRAGRRKGVYRSGEARALASFGRAVVGVADTECDPGGREAKSTDYLGQATDGSSDRTRGRSGAPGRLADTADIGRDRRRAIEARDGRDEARLEPERLRDVGRLADPHVNGRTASSELRLFDTEHHAQPCGGTRRLGDADSERAGRNRRAVPGQVAGEDGQHISFDADAPGPGILARAGPTNGFWRDADWILCRDGKWRPVEPGTFPLAHGAPARVGRLRAYGNAINAEAAVAWIETVMECLP